MKRGCISLGQISCDECKRLIPYPERYLGMETEDGKSVRLCIECATEKKLTSKKTEKGEEILTFFEGGEG